jgi:uncharacterized Zn finger protein
MALERLPRQLLLDCPACEEEQVRHRVLKGRVTTRGGALTMDVLVECGRCRDTRREVLKRREPRDVAVVISDGGTSGRDTFAMEEDEVLAVDDVIDLTDHPARVTALEVGDKRVGHASGAEVDTIWAVRFDRVMVKVSVIRGRETSAELLEAAVDDTFEVGSKVRLKGTEYVVDKIKRPGKVLTEGAVPAHEVQRLYVKPAYRPERRFRGGDRRSYGGGRDRRSYGGGRDRRSHERGKERNTYERRRTRR